MHFEEDINSAPHGRGRMAAGVFVTEAPEKAQLDAQLKEFLQILEGKMASYIEALTRKPPHRSNAPLGDESFDIHGLRPYLLNP